MPDSVTTPAVNVHALLRARYGAHWSPEAEQVDAPASPVIETLLNHRSVRAYSDRPLPDDLLQTLTAAAQSASTSSNLQAWSVVAVRDTARKARLAVCAGNQKHVAAAPLLLMFIADLSRLRRIAEAAGAPALALDYQEMFLVAVADAAFAAQNAVVALESLGLGCCYIGGMRNKPEDVAKELALPPGAFVVFGLTIGYPAEDVETDVKPRLPQQAVMHLEQYQSESAQSLADYDASLNVFQQLQHMKAQPWTAQASNRVRGPESLSGRDHLVSALHTIGFELK
jgi:nitroreductase